VPVSPAGVQWSTQMPIQWPSQSHSAAVVVEELATGAWGAAVISLPTAR
jgi:hypothetical protein